MKKYTFVSSINNNTGFTLIEVLITMIVSSVVVAAIYSSYTVQQKSYTVQEAVAEMQQNSRAALMMLSTDIRMAGFSPTGGTFGFVTGQFDNGAGLSEAVATNATNIAFTADLGGTADSDGDGILDYNSTVDRTCQDINGDGNIDISEMEQIAYQLSGTNLQRYSTTTGAVEWHTVAENIEAIEFVYLDNTGTVTATPADIRAIQISILTRASRSDNKFTNTKIYCPASNPFNPLTGSCTNPAPATIWSYNDNRRRRLLITTIQCRNMGL